MANAQKVYFVQKLANAANAMAAARRAMVDLAGVYSARKYAPGASDAITDKDIEETGYTAAQVSGFIATFHSRFNALMTNQAVSGTIAGDDIINVMRSD